MDENRSEVVTPQKGKRRALTYLIIGLLVVALPVTIYLTQRSQDIRQKAANELKNALESEGGTLSGPVTIGSDTSASDGKYISFNSVAATQAPTNNAPSPTTANPTVIPTSILGGTSLPSQVINLTNWKVTLPIGSSTPTEIFQPALATYKLDPWFIVAPGENAIRFRAPVNSPTTKNSSYPRSELREMANNGKDEAAWSSSTGTHTMFIDEKVTAVPKTKRHIVVGQIHDAGDDVIVIRLEYPKLFIDLNGVAGPTLDANYTLGKRFTIKFEVANNQTKVFYNGGATPAYTYSKTYSGAYFKAGAYVQSNCTKEAATDCNADNYGESVLYNVEVTHK